LMGAKCSIAVNSAPVPTGTAYSTVKG
jgi:hypothetical protein